MTLVSVVGAYAPASTPRDIVARLNREITRIMQSPKVRASLAAVAAEPIAASPQEFEALLSKDRERFRIIVREANIKVQEDRSSATSASSAGSS